MQAAHGDPIPYLASGLPRHPSLQEITEQPKYSFKTPEAALSVVKPKPHRKYSCLVSWDTQEGNSAFVMP